MILDELVKQLMKIKEFYPDSGKFQVLIEENETGFNYKIELESVITNPTKTQVIVSAEK